MRGMLRKMRIDVKQISNGAGMTKASESKNIRITPALWKALEDRMESDNRLGSVNSYANEILSNWVKGVVVDWEREKLRLGNQLRDELLQARDVVGVGPIRVVLERDEGKRKAAS
jgi:hypothetical protein